MPGDHLHAPVRMHHIHSFNYEFCLNRILRSRGIRFDRKSDPSEEPSGITNRGDIHGKNIQQTLLFTMNGRKNHEESIYYGDFPAGSMRSKDIMVELSLRSDEIRALK